MTARSVSTLIAAVVLFFAIPARSQQMGSAAPQPRAKIQLPDGDGKEVVQVACAACHSLSNITNTGHSPEDWKTTLSMMLNVGANVPPRQGRYGLSITWSRIFRKSPRLPPS